MWWLFSFGLTFPLFLLRLEVLAAPLLTVWLTSPLWRSIQSNKWRWRAVVATYLGGTLLFWAFAVDDFWTWVGINAVILATEIALALVLYIIRVPLEWVSRKISS